MSSLLFPAPKPDGAGSGLHRGEYWVDAWGHWHRIDGMTLGHVENAMAMIERDAALYAAREAMVLDTYMDDAPDGAYNAASQERAAILADTDAWLKSTHLYRALKKRRKELRKAIKKAASQ